MLGAGQKEAQTDSGTRNTYMFLVWFCVLLLLIAVLVSRMLNTVQVLEQNSNAKVKDNFYYQLTLLEAQWRLKKRPRQMVFGLDDNSLGSVTLLMLSNGRPTAEQKNTAGCRKLIYDLLVGVPVNSGEAQFPLLLDELEVDYQPDDMQCRFYIKDGDKFGYDLETGKVIEYAN